MDNSKTIVPFSFDNHQIRVSTDDQGSPWFVAKNVAEILGYDQTANGLKHCKGSSVLDELNKNNGLSPATKWIPEADVYRMVMRSNRPDAERFQDWVVEEVLPSIRKTGSYQVNQPSAQQIDANITALKLSPLAARAAKAFGFKGNMATLSADHAVRVITGSSPLMLFGQTALKAEDQDALLIVSEIADRLGVKTREVNPLLTKNALQTDYRDAKDRICYELTETGKAFGVYLDTGKKHGDGSPVRQIKWRASVVAFLLGQVRIEEDAA